MNFLFGGGGRESKEPTVAVLIERLASNTNEVERSRGARHLKRLLHDNDQNIKSFGAEGVAAVLDVLHNERDKEDLIEEVIGVLVEFVRYPDPSKQDAVAQHVQNCKMLLEGGSHHSKSMLGCVPLSPVIALLAIQHLHIRRGALMVLGGIASCNKTLGDLKYALSQDPSSIPLLMETLRDTREAVYTEALQVLCVLTTSRDETSVQMAFQGVFEQLTSILREETLTVPSAEVPLILTLLTNLLHDNDKVQRYFNEIGCMSTITRMISFARHEWAPLCDHHPLVACLCLKTISYLLAPGMSVATPLRDVLHKNGLPEAIVEVFDHSSHHPALATWALRCASHMIAHHPTNQLQFRSARCGPGKHTSGLMQALSLALAHPSVLLANLLDGLFESFLSNNPGAHVELALTMNPNPLALPEDGGVGPIGCVVTQYLLDTSDTSDAHLLRLWTCARIFHRVVQDSKDASELVLAFSSSLNPTNPLLVDLVDSTLKLLSAASSGASGISTDADSLLGAGDAAQTHAHDGHAFLDGPSRISVVSAMHVALLRLLAVWLHGSVKATQQFLSKQSLLFSLVDIISAPATSPYVKGMCALVLGVCLLQANSSPTPTPSPATSSSSKTHNSNSVNSNNSNASGISSSGVKGGVGLISNIIMNRISISSFADCWANLKQTPEFSVIERQKLLAETARHQHHAPSSNSHKSNRINSSASCEDADARVWVFDEPLVDFINEIDVACKELIWNLYASGPQPSSTREEEELQAYQDVRPYKELLRRNAEELQRVQSELKREQDEARHLREQLHGLDETATKMEKIRKDRDTLESKLAAARTEIARITEEKRALFDQLHQSAARVEALEEDMKHMSETCQILTKQMADVAQAKQLVEDEYRELRDSVAGTSSSSPITDHHLHNTEHFVAKISDLETQIQELELRYRTSENLRIETESVLTMAQQSLAHTTTQLQQTQLQLQQQQQLHRQQHSNSDNSNKSTDPDLMEAQLLLEQLRKRIREQEQLIEEQQDQMQDLHERLQSPNNKQQPNNQPHNTANQITQQQQQQQQHLPTEAMDQLHALVLAKQADIDRWQLISSQAQQENEVLRAEVQAKEAALHSARLASRAKQEELEKKIREGSQMETSSKSELDRLREETKRKDEELKRKDEQLRTKEEEMRGKQEELAAKHEVLTQLNKQIQEHQQQQEAQSNSGCLNPARAMSLLLEAQRLNDKLERRLVQLRADYTSSKQAFVNVKG